MGELIREILVQEQDHLIDLATALGVDPTKKCEPVVTPKTQKLRKRMR
jgi:hypothetical protein